MDGKRDERALIKRGRGGAPQLVETRSRRWSGAAEEEFLGTLATTCNVTRAADAAGFTKMAVYRRRMSHPDFAARWAQALDQGYARLELMLVEAATDALAGEPPDPDRPIPPMTADQALRVLQFHRGPIERGERDRRNWRLKPADPEAARASILRKVSAIRRARAKTRSKARASKSGDQ